MLFLKLKVVSIDSVLKHGPKITHADNSVTLKDFLETVNIDDGSKLDMHQIVEVLF